MTTVVTTVIRKCSCGQECDNIEDPSMYSAQIECCTCSGDVDDGRICKSCWWSYMGEEPKECKECGEFPYAMKINVVYVNITKLAIQ